MTQTEKLRTLVAKGGTYWWHATFVVSRFFVLMLICGYMERMSVNNIEQWNTGLWPKISEQKRFQHFSVSPLEAQTETLVGIFFSRLAIAARLQTAGCDRQTGAATPCSRFQSFPLWLALQAGPAQFLFGFLRGWATFAMEDFVWSAASVTPVTNSFLFPLPVPSRSFEFPFEVSQEVQEGFCRLEAKVDDGILLRRFCIILEALFLHFEAELTLIPTVGKIHLGLFWLIYLQRKMYIP